MSNDEIIVVRETPPGVVKQVNEIIIERGAGQGLPGDPGEAPTAQNIGDVIASAEAKTVLVDADGIGVSNSEDGDILVEWTYASLKAQLLAYFGGFFAVIGHALSTHSDMVVKVHGNLSGAVTFDYADGLHQTFTLAGIITGITWDNLPAGPWSMILEVTNGGAYAIAWGTVTIPGGSLTLTVAGVDKLVANGGGDVDSVGLAHEDLS